MSSKIEITKVCMQCGNEFNAKTTVTQFCGHTCANRNYKMRKKTEKINRVKSPTSQKIEYNLSKINEKEFLSIEDTCQLLGASRMTIYRQIKNGNIKAAKLGRRTIIKKSEIEKLFAL